MTPMQLTLLGIAGGAIFAYLIFRAKRADDRRRTAAHETEQRIAGVVDRYRNLVRSLESQRDAKSRSAWPPRQ
jgi:hypothetical protein